MLSDDDGEVALTAIEGFDLGFATDFGGSSSEESESDSEDDSGIGVRFRRQRAQNHTHQMIQNLIHQRRHPYSRVFVEIVSSKKKISFLPCRWYQLLSRISRPLQKNHPNRHLNSLQQLPCSEMKVSELVDTRCQRRCTFFTGVAFGGGAAGFAGFAATAFGFAADLSAFFDFVASLAISR